MNNNLENNNLENNSVDATLNSTSNSKLNSSLPMKKRKMIRVAVATALAVCALGLYLGLTPGSTQIQGMADADSLKVSAKITARIAELYTHEGQRVEAGQTLFRLDSPEVEAKYNQAIAVLDAAKSQAEKAEYGARTEQIRAAEANWQRAKAASDITRDTANRLDGLYQEGVVSRQQRDEAIAQAKSAEALTHAAKAQFDEAKSGARQQDKDAAQAQVRQAQAAVAEVTAARIEVLGLAPSSGEVSKRLADIGELVPAGYPVFTLVDVDNMWVSFTLREDQFNNIQTGQTVHGDIPALGLEDIAFEVFFISPAGEFATWRATRQSVGYDVRSFEIRVRPQTKIDNFRPGMSVLFSWPQALKQPTEAAS